MQPLAAITLMQSFPLHAVHDSRSPLAFANGQYILIERTAYDAAGGHEAVRDRFVEDIALASRVKDLGLPIRVALVRRYRVLPDVFLAGSARAGLEPDPLRRPGPQSLRGSSASCSTRDLLPVRPSGPGGRAGPAGLGTRPHVRRLARSP